MGRIDRSLTALFLLVCAANCNSEDSVGASASSSGSGGTSASSTGPSASHGAQSSSSVASTGAGGMGGVPNGTGGFPYSTGAIGVGAGDNGGYPVPADCNTMVNTPDSCIYCIKQGCCGAALNCLGDSNCVCWMSCMGMTNDAAGCCAKCGPPSYVTKSLTECAQSSCSLCQQQLLTCN